MKYKDSFDYVYPKSLDLHPESDKSKNLTSLLVSRFTDFASSISEKHPTWRALDDSLKAYVDTDEEEQAIKEADERKPVSIVMPISYAVLETLLSFMMQRFLKTSFFRYQGYDPKDDIKVKLLEKVIGYQFIKNKMALNLHTMWRDAFVYSVGPMFINWEASRNLSGEIVKEGNRFFNIDPFNLLPDSSVPLVHYDRATNFGWVSYMTKEEILDREVASDNTYYNGLYVQKSSSTVFRERTFSEGKNTYLIEVLHCFVNLIPAEWNLGQGLYPEKWYFEIASNNIILRMEHIGGSEKRFPFVVCVPEFNGHDLLGTSRIEILRNLQGVYDWMLSSHIANVRKNLHDMWIVDPSIINVDDLLTPEPGKVIRLRRSQWGTGKINEAIQQVPVNDITRQHIADSSFIESMINKVSGISDSSFGVQERKGERVSSAEAQQTSQNAISRLERLASIIDIQCHADLAELVAQNTLEFSSSKFHARLNAEEVSELMKLYPDLGLKDDARSISLDKDFLNVGFDVISSMQGEEFKSTNALAWVEIFKTFGNMPQLTEKFDMSKILISVAKSLGIKDVSSFLLETPIKIQTEEEIQKGVQSGQLRAI